MNFTWYFSWEFHAEKIHVKITLKQCLNFHMKFIAKFTRNISLLLPVARENFKWMCLWLLLFLDCRMSSFVLCFPEWLSRVKRIGCRSTTWPSCSALPSSGPRQSPQTWPPTWYTRAGSWSTAYWNLRTYLGEKSTLLKHKEDGPLCKKERMREAEYKNEWVWCMDDEFWQKVLDIFGLCMCMLEEKKSRC